MSEGSVFVRWYGSVVEGSVVENTSHDGPLASMMAVRIPLMGMHPVALFCPQHVYETAAQASAGVRKEAVKRQVPVAPAVEPVPTVAKPVSAAWSQLQQFKCAHWDEQRNHLQTDALDEFYQMWREGVRQRRAAATRTNDRARQEEAQTCTRRVVAPQPQRREKPVIKQLSLFDL